MKTPTFHIIILMVSLKFILPSRKYFNRKKTKIRPVTSGVGSKRNIKKSITPIKKVEKILLESIQRKKSIKRASKKTGVTVLSKGRKNVLAGMNK